MPVETRWEGSPVAGWSSSSALAIVPDDVPATSARALRVLWSFMVVVTFEPLPVKVKVEVETVVEALWW
jgi:hypothetical protein